MNKLSILIPTYNEAATIQKVLGKVCSIRLLGDLQKDIIVIDDGSSDPTPDLIREFISRNPEANIVFDALDTNEGKGSALRKGIGLASGDVLVIQDADLEYDPEEYNLLLKPILEDYADVVYGSRFVGGKPHRILFFWHTIGNKFLTFLSNFFTDLNLTDMEVGLKMFRTSIIQSIDLQENRFGFEPEITAKIARIPHIRIYEVGVSYYGRTYREGKKAKWKDGFRAIYCILKYNLFVRK
jgi:glycosyltransferase involved in cell wall biosynthesis